jgi:putative transposase
MNKEELENKNELIGNFRYGVIADLLNPYLRNDEFSDLLSEKACREYEIPFSKRTGITVATIRNWLRKYKERGLAGLKPRVRKDYGKPKSFTDEEQEILIDFLKENTHLTARAAVIKLQKQGKIKSDIKQSSLSRFIVANELTREKRTQEKAKEKNLRFEFFAPLECIQADTMHLFKVPDETGRERKAYLLAFIDDATRRIVYSDISFSDDAYGFEKGIKHILRSHGRIGKIYVDNGAAFVSSQTMRILRILGIALIHSRPYKPKGRGKIERFNRTARDQFFRPLDRDSIRGLEDLNIRFKTWLESDYHRNPHRGLNNKSPLEAWVSKTHLICTVSPEIDLDEVFLHEIQRKIYGDNTFTLDGCLYEVPGILAGKGVKVRYEPENKSVLKVFFEGKEYGEARKLDAYSNSRILRNTHSKTISESETSLKKDTSKSEKSIHIISSLAASKTTGGK